MYEVHSPCFHNSYIYIYIPYQRRASKLEQPLRRATKYGFRTFSYVGCQVLNSILNDNGGIAHIDFNEFKIFLNAWKMSGYIPIYYNLL